MNPASGITSLLRLIDKRRFRDAMLIEASHAIAEQTLLLGAAARKIDEWQQLALHSQRAARDIAVAWQVAMEKPEIDVRDEVGILVRDLSDNVAALEETVI